VAAQIRRYFDSLRQHETTTPMLESMLDFDGLNAVIGTPELMALGQRYAGYIAVGNTERGKLLTICLSSRLPMAATSRAGLGENWLARLLMSSQ
jgi:hypothetical protein